MTAMQQQQSQNPNIGHDDDPEMEETELKDLVGIGYVLEEVFRY